MQISELNEIVLETIALPRKLLVLLLISIALFPLGFVFIITLLLLR